jgi:hypothetical protein
MCANITNVATILNDSVPSDYQLINTPKKCPSECQFQKCFLARAKPLDALRASSLPALQKQNWDTGRARRREIIFQERKQTDNSQKRP